MNVLYLKLKLAFHLINHMLFPLYFGIRLYFLLLFSSPAAFKGFPPQGVPLVFER